MVDKNINYKENQITVFQNKYSLFEIKDEMTSKYEGKDEYNKKIVFVTKKKEQKSQLKQATFFMDYDLAKLLAFDIVHGYFKDNMYNTSQSGSATFIGGGKQCRYFNIQRTDNGSYRIQIAIHENVGINGNVKAGKRIDEHTSQVPEMEVRKMFLELLYTIDRRLTFIEENPLTTSKNTKKKETQKQEKTEEQSFNEIIDEGESIIGDFFQDEDVQDQEETEQPKKTMMNTTFPSGKYAGQTLASQSHNKSYLKFLYDTVKGEQWNDVKEVLGRWLQ